MKALGKLLSASKTVVYTNGNEYGEKSANLRDTSGAGMVYLSHCFFRNCFRPVFCCGLSLCKECEQKSPKENSQKGIQMRTLS